jgi:2-iminobutanoate/2-iminopropanoate deaminase
MNVMPRNVISLDNPALKDLPFSPGVRAGDLIYFSGQVGLDPATGKLASGGVAAETAQTFANIETVLKAAGRTLDDVIKANVYLSDMADYAAMNDAYARAFARPFPARTCVGVAALPLGARVEIEVITG